MKVELQPEERAFFDQLISKTGAKWDGITVSFQIFTTLVILDFSFKYRLTKDEEEIVRGIYNRKDLKKNKLAVWVNQKEGEMRVIETW